MPTLLYCIQRQRGIEQRLARRAHNPEVTGSNPVPATKTIHPFFRRGIEQRLARRAHNPEVVSSNLTPATNKRTKPASKLILYAFALALMA